LANSEETEGPTVGISGYVKILDETEFLPDNRGGYKTIVDNPRISMATLEALAAVFVKKFDLQPEDTVIRSRNNLAAGETEIWIGPKGPDVFLSIPVVDRKELNKLVEEAEKNIDDKNYGEAKRAIAFVRKILKAPEPVG